MKRTKSNSAELIQRIAKMPEIKLDGLEAFFKPEEMPEFDYSPVGRHRLLQAFRNKYGESYRNKRGVMKLIKDFDNKRDLVLKILKVRE
jgi:hypothetical protein